MTVRPIIFSAPMVNALLEDRKTMTRRILNPQPKVEYDLASETQEDLELRDMIWDADNSGLVAERHLVLGKPLAYAVGDLLWMRERWRAHRDHDQIAPRDLFDWSRVVVVSYEADGDQHDWLGRVRAAMHMPRTASRLTLEVTGVKIERLQDISEEDARAEGVLWVPGHGEITPADLHEGYSNYLCCRQGFEVLWDSINSKRGYVWKNNPYVVALTFTVHKRNVDALANAGRDDG
jgi:hypothetical protein